MSTGTRARVDRRDLVTVVSALVLVGLAAAVAGLLYAAGRPVQAGAAPLYAHWLPHVGPGTPGAVLVAGLVIWRGPAYADRLGFGRLLVAGYAAAVAWTLSLALVDGWHRGVAGRLTTRHEYLSEVDGVTDVPAMLRGFATRILDFQPDSWSTHVSGHPPGALLVFVGLDRAGLGGGAWAGLFCVLVGATVAVSVPVALRACGDETAARCSVPFVVLFPGAVWVGVSADGLFAGVTAAGLALLAVGLRHRSPWAATAAGGLLGFGIYLSYGLVLMAPLVLAVVWLCRPSWHLVLSVAGALVVAGGFTVAGFWWLDGYHLVVQRYYQGVASERPYAYWVWANLAAAVLCAGPAAVVVLRRAVVSAARWAGVAARGAPASWRGLRPPPAGVLLVLAAAFTVAVADASGLSKAEVERIWLPFLPWLLAGAALLPVPGRRGWLLAQAATALVVNHLLLTTW